MKKLMIITMILMTSMVFAQQRGGGDCMGGDCPYRSMKNGKMMKDMTPEERHKLRTERKYKRIKKQLLKKDADLILPIIKKYDKKVFELMKPQKEARKQLRESEYANPDKKLALMEKGLDLRIKVLKLKKKQLKELKATGVSSEILIRIAKHEMKRFHKMGKHRRGHKGMWKQGKGKRHGKKGKKRP